MQPWCKEPSRLRESIRSHSAQKELKTLVCVLLVKETGMKTINGDIIVLAKQGKFDVLVHGCNCFNSMGAGVARQIKNTFPAAWHADQETQKGDRDKLGTYTQASVKLEKGRELIVVNAYTQYHYSGGGKLVDYDALGRVFEAIARDFPGKHIAYPAIGAGLAGGDWDKISVLIDNALAKHEHTLVLYG